MNSKMKQNLVRIQYIIQFSIEIKYTSELYLIFHSYQVSLLDSLEHVNCDIKTDMHFCILEYSTEIRNQLNAEHYKIFAMNNNNYVVPIVMMSS